MAHTQEVLEHLEHWQSKRFRSNEITLAEAAKSLETDEPLVVAKPGTNQSRWIMMKANTDKVAILVFAGIWKWGADLETGNFVPQGKQAPDGIPSDRIQQAPSFKCELTYAFDTSVDDSIWDHLRVFEDHVTTQSDFNKGNRPRRKWQDGKTPANREKYIVTSKIFVRRTPFNSRANAATEVPYNVHPWISNAIKEFEESKQIPNPERPQYYDFSEGVLRKLEETTDPRFNRNDIILVTCKVGFVVSGDSWWTEIIPLELVRVDKIPEVTSPQTDVSLYPQLSDELTPLGLGEPIELFDEPPKTLKRKERDSDEPIPVPTKRRTLQSEADSAPESESGSRAEAPIVETSEATTSRPNLRHKTARESRATRI